MIIDDFLRYMETERVASPRTIQTYRDVLKEFESYVASLDNQSLETVDTDIVRDWMSSLMERGNKPSYVCKQLSAVKSLYRYALKRQLVNVDPAYAVKGPKKQKPLPVFLKEQEANRLFDELTWDYSNIDDVRARTLLLLLYSTGIRRAEATALNDCDVNFINSELKVTGKRRKQRIVPMGSELSEALQSYIRLRDETLPHNDEGAFFISNKGMRISGAQIYYIVKRYLSLVTTMKKKSPHVLRHSFATAMLNNDASLGCVQKLLGHESIATTEIYTHVTFEDLKRIYAKAHPRAEDENNV